MSSKIESKPVPVVGGEGGRITINKGAATPKGPGFGAVLAGARPILKGAEAVAAVLPGGPLLSAAVKAAPTVMSGTTGAVPAGGVTGGVPMTPRMPGTAPSTSAAPTGAGAAEGSGIENVLAESQAFNMYYLQLQEEISAENRQYSALSNVLKARHDTVKNAIGNIR